MFSIRPQRRTGAHPYQPTDAGHPGAGRSRPGPSRRARALAALLGVPLACTVLAGVAPVPAAASWPNGQVEISGHGFGHGRGMGQYGAFGYATLYSWSYTQIL